MALYVISLSGGKDSTATALLSLELHARGHCRFVFADSREREMVDLLVTNILRGRPRIRDLSDRFDLPKSNIGRLSSAYRVLVEGARRAALKRLDVQMRDAAIVVDLEGGATPSALDNVGQDEQNSPRLVASTT